MGSLVTVASFATSHEAALAKARLAESGIPAVVHGDQHARLFGGMGAVAGSIDVQVHADDEDAARSILSLDVSGYDEFLTSLEAEGSDDAERESFEDRTLCPNCGSDDLLVQKHSPGALFIGILLLGIPLLFMKRGHECAMCGHKWKQ